MKNLLFIFFLSICQVILAQKTRGELLNEDKIEENMSGKYHAIIISENEYQDESISDLAEPKNDADKLYKILLDKYNFNSSAIIRLIDPTRNEVIDALDKKRKQLSEDDNLLIFYAGHGYWDEGLKMGYWFPSDARKGNKGNWLSNTTLTTYINAIQAKHVLLISDACFSGGIFKTRSVGAMDSGMKRLYDLKSRKAISSGNMKEVPDQSVLMRFLMKQLEINNEQFLSTDQLFASIRPNVLNNSQTEPLYGVIQMTGDEGGEFVFYNSQSENASDENNELVAEIKNQQKRSVVPVINEENKMLQKPTRVAIISFDNSSGKESEYGDLGGPLRDMLTSDLNSVENLSMVDRQALQKVLEEQNLNNSKKFDQSTATKIGKLLGAEMIITGTYFEMFGSLRVDAKLINVETGEIAFSVGADGAREKFFDLKNNLANLIIEKLK